MGKTDFTHNTFHFAEEFCGLDFGDRRLNERFVRVLENFASQPGSIIQRTQGSWAEMMAAYRLFDNDRVSEAEILAAHKEQTLSRVSQYDKVVAIQDTTALCFSSHLATEGLGSITLGNRARDARGILLHTTLVLTPKGMPLGILHQSMWSRGGTLKKGDELFESERWRWLNGISHAADANFTEVICVSDREADGCDYFAQASRKKVKFIVRAKEKMRASSTRDEKLIDELRREAVGGQAKLTVRSFRRKGVNKKHRPRHTRQAKLSIRYKQVELREQNKSLLYPLASQEERTLWAVLVEEVNPPQAFEPVCWLLLTNLAVTSSNEAMEVIDLYKVRWEIEVFHKLLKSVCQVEDAQLESATRLRKLIASLSVVAWRLHVLTKAQREQPDLPSSEVLAPQEWQALYLAINKTRKIPKRPPSLRQATLWIAKLGGFIGRKSDGEPGPMTLARGWQKLIHYVEMFETMKDVYKC